MSDFANCCKCDVDFDFNKKRIWPIGERNPLKQGYICPDCYKNEITTKQSASKARKEKRAEKAKTLWPRQIPCPDGKPGCAVIHYEYPKPRKTNPRRKKSPTLSKLKKLLWHEISMLVRSWSPFCQACHNAPTQCAAHIVPSNEGASTRYFLPNLYPCCINCNGLEKWNRATWVYHHREMFGEEYVDALYMMSNEVFQLKKDWVLEQTERIKRLRAAQSNTGTTLLKSQALTK